MDAIVLKYFLPEIFLSVCVLAQLILNSRLITNLKYNFPTIDKEVFIQTFFNLVFLANVFFVIGPKKPHKNVTPLYYVSGKMHLKKFVLNIIENRFDVKAFNSIVSPFCGGGALEFSLQYEYNLKLFMNDTNSPLMSFWVQAKLNRQSLCLELRRIKDDKFSLDTVHSYWKKFKVLHKSEPLLAAYYFCLNRCAHSTATRSGIDVGKFTLKGFTENSIFAIEKLNLTQVCLSNLDYKKFLVEFCTAKSLVLLDPPHFVEATNYKAYSKEDCEFDHGGLFDFLTKECKSKNWILIYNDSEWVRKKYWKYEIWNFAFSRFDPSNSTYSIPFIVIISKKV